MSRSASTWSPWRSTCAPSDVPVQRTLCRRHGALICLRGDRGPVLRAVRWDTPGVNLAEHRASALLLDMDGVLVDSTDAVTRDWGQWARRRGLDPEDVLALGHGAPSRDVVAHFVAADEVDDEASWVESLALNSEAEIALPGALKALSQTLLLVAVVTSATRDVAVRRLARAGLPIPAVLVTADDVARGKPDPEPYLRAARLLKVEPADCVAIEDTPMGLTSIRRAGAFPIAVTTTFDASQLTKADVVLGSLSQLQILGNGVAWPLDETPARRAT